MKKSDILDIYRSKNTVFTFKDISLIWGDVAADSVKAKINYYVKTGKLYPIRRGIYAKDENYNKFELATKIYTPSYISLETVLIKEGVIFQYYKDIFVVSYLARKIVCDNQTYNFRKVKDTILANTLGLERKENYYIAKKERAFLDMLYLYKDYHFDNLESIDWEVCFELLPVYGKKNLVKKLDLYHKEYVRH